MKALKIFAALVLFTGFAAVSVNAQSTSAKAVDISFEVYIPCADEVASGTFSLHFVDHFDKDGNWTKTHAQPMGGSLVGELTGTVYHPVGKTQTQMANQYTFTNTFRMVGTGANAVTYSVQQVFHYTINANGDLTALVDQTTITCD